MFFFIEYIYAISCTNGRSPLGLLGVNNVEGIHLERSS